MGFNSGFKGLSSQNTTVFKSCTSSISYYQLHVSASTLFNVNLMMANVEAETCS